ncbi:cyclic GMP-AMP synthase-like receptor [Montipora foliosa]|uniref:cyclic GMP-AMP synthase-like receptor n=1 Tax=Montipora foliosa TaxID=591990 RepID=UPI0035F1D310
MAEIADHFERKARFVNQSEAKLIREKLERLVINVLSLVEKRDKRFQSSLIKSGSVYEGVKVGKPDEFDFMIRLNLLTDKASFHPCDKGEGYVKLDLDEYDWREFKDEEGFFNPNLLCRHFKKLVNESSSDAEVPDGLRIQRVRREYFDGSWGPVFSDLLGNSSGQENPSGVMYSETHGPATTLYIDWEGGESYRGLKIGVDLTLSLEYPSSKLPVQLAKLPPEVDMILQKSGFHVVPAGFDVWRISFSMVEQEVLYTSPEGFKACYRVLKIVRDDVSESLGLNPCLVPSYMFKTVLVSHLFTTPGHLWEKDLWSQTIIQILDLVLQGMKRGGIQSFFIPRYNLLSARDRDHKLRQFVVEEMLNQMKGLKMAHTLEEARETKRQIRVLEMVDLWEYMISSALSGKDPTALWNKMFLNIGNVPGSRKFGWFWNQFSDLNTTELDEDAYKRLKEIWNIVEEAFKQLLATLQGELNMLVQKFYIRTCEKKMKYELEHRGVSECQVEQVPIRLIVSEILEDIAECYIEEENSSWANLHKALPPEFTPTCFLSDVADVTEREGSVNGLSLLKQRLKDYLLWVPENYLMTLTVGYVRHIALHAKDILRRKLDYITIPELDLD